MDHPFSLWMVHIFFVYGYIIAGVYLEFGNND